MAKFKVGDRVKKVNGIDDVCADIGDVCLFNGESIITKKGSCTCWADWELVEESNIKLNDGSCPSENKATNIMSKITEFVKSSLLSADEKLLRKYGLKDSCGEFTIEAQNLVIIKLVKENEAYLVEQAKALEVDENIKK